MGGIEIVEKQLRDDDIVKSRLVVFIEQEAE